MTPEAKPAAQGKTYERRSDYKPRMIRVSNAKVTLDEFRLKIANRVNVNQDGDDFLMFTSSKYWFDKVQELFSGCKAEIVDSDNKKFQDSLKIQSALNWRKFKSFNADTCKDDKNSVQLILRSIPSDASNPDLARKYAISMASICYQNDEKHAVQFVIRPWLIEQFKTLRDDKEFKDDSGAQVNHYLFFVNKSPMERPMDKSVQCRVIIPISKVQGIIDSLTKLEKFPQVQFVDPSKNKERMEKKRTNYKNRRTERNETRANQRKPRDNKPTDDSKPRTNRRTNGSSKPRTSKSEGGASIEISSERPKSTNNSSKPRDVRFELTNVPETMEVTPLKKSLDSAIDGEVTVKKSGAKTIIFCKPELADKLEGVLGRLKINQVTIEYQRK